MTRRAIAGIALMMLITFGACSSSSDGEVAASDPAGGGDTASPDADTPEEVVDLGDLARIGTDDPLNQDSLAPGAERMRFSVPIEVAPGQNNIAFTGPVDHPDVPGWVTRISTNIMRPDGSVPPVDIIHLHHGVWLNQGEQDITRPGLPERMYAAGEEKTVGNMPLGYGYFNDPEDDWIINYMLHNAIPAPETIHIVYDLDFIPADVPEAADIAEARPVWLDVDNGSIYPIFDALLDADTDGDGLYTFPTDTAEAEAAGVGRWVADKNYQLLAGAGHLHPGGLFVDIFLERDGAAAEPGSAAADNAEGNRTHLFRSEAVYYEPAGPVSWDVSMTATPADWRIDLRAGDTLDISTTYDVSKASWYEAMGIFVLWATEEPGGSDPFVDDVNLPGEVTHGELPENDNHGGEDTGLPDPRDIPSGEVADVIGIADFVYEEGDISEGDAETIPVVNQGETITFDNSFDNEQENGIWHTVTACEAPCTASTGVAFPIADGRVQFDSGELGTGGPPTADRVDWATPADLDPGTYTYFCRVHPFMRGAFRVVEPAATTS